MRESEEYKEMYKFALKQIGEPNQKPGNHGLTYGWNGKLKKVGDHYETRVKQKLQGDDFAVFVYEFRKKFGAISILKREVEDVYDVARTE